MSDSEKPGSEVTQDEHYELPQGWVWASLGTVCVVNPRHERDALPNEASVSFIPMAAVDQQSGSISGSVARPYGEVRKGFTHFGEGDVLFARITPCMENGKIAIARGLVNGLGCGTTEFHVLRPFGGILSEYIYRYLRQESFRRAAAANMSGTAGQLRVPTDYIKSVELPLAPLAEQRRIVAKVEALFEQSSTARQALDRIPFLLKKFRQSVLAAAFRGDLTRDWREQHPDVEPASALLERIRAERLRRYQEEVKKAKAEGRRLPRRPTTTALAKVAESARFDAPRGWEWATIGDLVTPDLGGRPFVTSGSRGWAKYYSTTGDKFIRSENINTNYLRLDDAVCVQVPRGGEAERTRVSPGDVLLTITGSNIGRAATVPLGVSQAYVSQHVAIIRLNKSIQPEYVWLWLMAEVTGQRQLREFYYGQTKPGLSLEQIKAVAIALPSEAEQHVIINRVKELSVLADHIEKRLVEARVRADKLDQSILARAFRGELVPQDPNDEPAVLLLDGMRGGHERPTVRTNTRFKARQRNSSTRGQ